MAETPGTIRIAAALIEDDQGRVLLVRKAGTPWFMQAGGKIEAAEAPLTALRRELREEIGIEPAEDAFRYLGRFFAAAANEPGCTVEAELFRLRTANPAIARAEIAEVVWVAPAAALSMPLAPLTRDCVLPLAC